MNRTLWGVPLLAIIAIAASCSSVSVPSLTPATPSSAAAAVPVFGAECANFQADGSDSFYATSRTYTDPDPLELEAADPADVGLTRGLLDRAADNAALNADIASLLVVRDGKLVYERYFNGFDASSANNVQSYSKSVLSLITGAAIDDGYLDLDSRIDEFLAADLVGAHGGLTIFPDLVARRPDDSLHVGSPVSSPF